MGHGPQAKRLTFEKNEKKEKPETSEKKAELKPPFERIGLAPVLCPSPRAMLIRY